MSNIKLVYTRMGQIIGDFSSTISGYTVENPVIVAPGPQGVNFVPLLMFAEETRLALTPDDMYFDGQLLEPLAELRNAYNERFGSGIQLLT